MSEGAIKQRLDLLIRLVDTTSGNPVSESDTHFLFRGEKLWPLIRPNGNYLLINHGREDGPMRIVVSGYEPWERDVVYANMDERLPALDVFLIPSEKERPGLRYLSLSGQLEGITSIEAVNLSKPVTSFREVDKRRRAMTLYMPNRRVSLPDMYYGVAHVAEGMYEDIVIERELNDRKVLLKEPLGHDFPQNSPIFRVIFGQTDAQGNYLLRLLVEGGKKKYLVKYVVNQETRFQTIDFDETNVTSLEG